MGIINIAKRIFGIPKKSLVSDIRVLPPKPAPEEGDLISFTNSEIKCFIYTYLNIERILLKSEPPIIKKLWGIRDLRKELERRFNVSAYKELLIFLDDDEQLIILVEKLINGFFVSNNISERINTLKLKINITKKIPLLKKTITKDGSFDYERIKQNLKLSNNDGEIQLITALSEFIKFCYEKISELIGRANAKKSLKLTYKTLQEYYYIPATRVYSLLPEGIFSEEENYSVLLKAYLEFVENIIEQITSHKIKENTRRLFKQTCKKIRHGTNKNEKTLNSLFFVLFEEIVKLLYLRYNQNKIRLIFENAYEKLRDEQGASPISVNILKYVPRGILETEKYDIQSKEDLKKLILVTKSVNKRLENAKNNSEIEIRKRTLELTKAKTHLKSEVKIRTKRLEIAYKENIKKYKELRKLNKGIIKKSIDLTETKSQLEDKNIDLIKSNKEIEQQKTELIRKTIALSEIRTELEQKNLELAKANKEILDVLKIKTEFINQASHDLRTPLTPILALLPLLRAQLKEQEGMNNLRVIERNANHLKHIVDELIGMINLRKNEFRGKIEYLDIKDVINEVISNNEIKFQQNNIRLVKKFNTYLPKIGIDKFQIVELLQNLLDNAVKYSLKGKSHTIIITAKKIDNFINVKMSDTGIGMSKTTLRKIFTEFFRADMSRHIEGIGLGLSICKRIVERHNGRIWAKSKGIGKGSSIIFELPINLSSS